jgi:YidC/Oxa1 family membrane protein insertase
MQALNPKITAIREKYKDNSQRMNQEIAALYKKEKVNPLGGCLPILLQMPIFISFYGVLTKHFALRGQPFVWWINDLSEPDSVLSFGDFTVPLLGWNDLRLLPILFVGTQILSSKFMQSPQSTGSSNMKLMSTLMPVFFFFILYNAPSGLLLYWIMTNVLTAGQQYVVNKYRKTHPGKEKK